MYIQLYGKTSFESHENSSRPLLITIFHLTFKVGIAKEGREKIKFSAVCPTTSEEVDSQITVGPPRHN
jgi:hypothetical protein